MAPVDQSANDKRTSPRAAAAAAPTSAFVWRSLARSANAVLGHVTPRGEPRTSGVVYAVVDRKLYVAVAPDSWKARQIVTGSPVSVTVLVHRGGPLPLLFPIPPATITFQGLATTYPPGAEIAQAVLARLSRLLPPDRREDVCLIEIEPRGHFLTYGIGVPLRLMREPEKARFRVPVG